MAGQQVDLHHSLPILQVRAVTNDRQITSFQPCSPRSLLALLTRVDSVLNSWSVQSEQLLTGSSVWGSSHH